MSYIDDIRTFLQTKLSQDVYAFRRPKLGDSITIKPSSASPESRPFMTVQDDYFDIEIVNSTSPQTAYNLLITIRDLLLGRQGKLVVGGVDILNIYAENTLPNAVDILENGEDVYGMTFRVKYKDDTLPKTIQGGSS